MHVPSADELAAIAAAYIVVTERSEPPPVRDVSRWSLAGRLDTDPDVLRAPRAGARRWETAARLAL